MVGWVEMLGADEIVPRLDITEAKAGASLLLVAAVEVQLPQDGPDINRDGVGCPVAGVTEDHHGGVVEGDHGAVGVDSPLGEEKPHRLDS